MSWTLEWYEIIDNENVDKKLCNIEDNSERCEVERILSIIDSQTKYDIDLAYNSRTWKYRFISGETVLNIPLTASKLEEVWDIIVEMLNNDDIYIGWYKFWRYIKVDEIWKFGIFNRDIIPMNDKSFTKNEKEELFKFVMDVKWIPIWDWEIEWPIIKWDQDQAYYDVFWVN